MRDFAALAKRHEAVLEQKLIENVEEIEKVVSEIAPDVGDEDEEQVCHVSLSLSQRCTLSHSQRRRLPEERRS